ncbi:MAG: hypothetical protein KatS3mg062_1117 [Tepidiforma sp.]|nr:MAG: hypothetical protein KatS3mg062_1117 [Tepidiforma sp.]
MPRELLKAREFLFLTEELAMRALPPGIPQPSRRVMWTILQLSWGEPAFHVELQPQPARGIVELGLHFEGAPEANDARAALVAAHAAPLMAALGPAWELEAWTASWRRLHRTFPFETLTRQLAETVASELSRVLPVLYPFCLPVPEPRLSLSAAADTLAS